MLDRHARRQSSAAGAHEIGSIREHCCPGLPAAAKGTSLEPGATRCHGQAQPPAVCGDVQARLDLASALWPGTQVQVTCPHLHSMTLWLTRQLMLEAGHTRHRRSSQGGTGAATGAAQQHLRGALGCLSAAAWQWAEAACACLPSSAMCQRTRGSGSIQECCRQRPHLHAGNLSIVCTAVGFCSLCMGVPCASPVGNLSCDLTPITTLQSLLTAGLMKPLLAAAVASSPLCQYSSTFGSTQSPCHACVRRLLTTYVCSWTRCAAAQLHSCRAGAQVNRGGWNRLTQSGQKRC